MEEATSAELSPPRPLEADTAALPGRDLAEELHETEYPALVRFLLLHGASWNEAQDAAQDAFTQMCAPGVAIRYPKAWLRTVAWRSWVAQQVRLEDSCAEPPEPRALVRWQTPAHAAELGEEARRVTALLLRLPAKQRAAMAWHLDGFTTQESARAMGTTQAAVRQNLARARAALRVGLGLEGGGVDDVREDGRDACREQQGPPRPRRAAGHQQGQALNRDRDRDGGQNYDHEHEQGHVREDERRDVRGERQ
ncbi:sigma factor-like helix-turn-helix DNA-binding protein [Streptomyces sp. CC224B]|uniref:sigma factor-like helix-turn-helix DNA-binding protein n=1 Tax=Streptomyces sp. CC224B TaxID=3044571 RepID=UPI0024A9F90E|nr:sigma factor-like helix-turn-helix DNA-binding protein [Streptomyces sp. CC224B]